MNLLHDNIFYFNLKIQKKDCFLAYYVYKLVPLMKVFHCMRIINILNWLGIRHSICTKNTDSLNLKGMFNGLTSFTEKCLPIQIYNLDEVI